MPTQGTRLPNGRVVSAFEARETLRGLVSRTGLWLIRATDATPDQPPPQDGDSIAIFGRLTAEENFESVAYELDRIESLVEDLAGDIERARAQIKRKRAILAERRKIAKLRGSAGRAPTEAEVFAAKADARERKLNAELEAVAKARRF
jgi:hypothetical protein